MTLGIFWTGHSSQYIYIEKSDRYLNWLSLFFLLLVSTLHFTSAFLSEYIHFRLAVFLYLLDIFALGVMLYVYFVYADKHNYINLPEAEKTGHWQSHKKQDGHSAKPLFCRRVALFC